ncbi:hypothetical protein P3S67_013221 [Capsicum chacoense]
MDGDVLSGTFSSSACTNQPRGNDANHSEPGNTSCLSLRCNEEGNGDLQQSLIDGPNPPTTNELSATNHSLLSYSNLGDTVGPVQPATLSSFPTFPPVLPNFEDIVPLYHHWQVQGLTQGTGPLHHATGMMRSLETTSAHLPNNIPSSSQVLPHSNPPLRTICTSTEEIEEALELMRETRTEIMILKDKSNDLQRKVREKIHTYLSPNLSKTSIDIRRPFNTQIGNYVLILNPTMSAPDSDPELTIAPPVDRPLINPPRLNRSMNIIIWNCRGGNNPEFKRNFRSLVALLETKIQNHQAKA